MCDRACTSLLHRTTPYVCIPVHVCVHVNASVMSRDQLPADSLNTRAESIIMRVTTQWITNRDSSSRGRRRGEEGESFAAGDVISSPMATVGAGSRGWKTAAALPPQNNKEERGNMHTSRGVAVWWGWKSNEGWNEGKERTEWTGTSGETKHKMSFFLLELNKRVLIVYVMSSVHTYTNPPEWIILITCLAFAPIGPRQIAAQLALSTSMQSALTLIHIYRTHMHGRDMDKFLKSQWHDSTPTSVAESNNVVK